MSPAVRKILFITTWVLLIAYLLYSLIFVKKRAEKVICNKVEINVKDSAMYQFVTSEIVRNKLHLAGKVPVGQPISNINTDEIEAVVAQMREVRDVQAYVSLSGVLSIDVKQRKPIVRIFNASNQSYYIDDRGFVMPVSANFSARVLVVSGNIREPFVPKANVNVMCWRDSLYRGESPLICRIYEIVRYIVADEFWSAQIEQVFVDDSGDVLLIPVVGPHTVLLGSIGGYELKLKKLKVLYEKALPYEGWNKYRVINLKYSNQIICTKWE